MKSSLSQKISIIIPTLNEEENIANTLEIVSGTQDVEVIVADCGSSDDTISISRKYGARVISSPDGRARQMNTGASEANGDILLFLHADTLLPYNYTHHIRKTLCGSGTVAGAFSLSISGRGIGLRMVERLANFRARTFQMPYGDQAIFLHSAMFQSLGGYPDLPIMEDFELIRRLKTKGRIVTLPDYVTTSARRWKKYGVIRTTAVNQAIVMAYLAGVNPQRLALWYGSNKGGDSL